MDEDMPPSNCVLDGGQERQDEEFIDLVADEDLDEEDEEQEQQQKKAEHAVYAHTPMQPCSQTLPSPEPTMVTSTEQMSATPSPGHNPVRRGEDAEDEEDEKSFATPASDPPSSNSSQESPLQNHHKRFLQLQAFLKVCDEADQNELLQGALRSLSAAARSGHAFNLEYRALLLSMEEGREMLRLKMLNVMGGRGKDDQTSTPGSTPEGSRLPAPGSIDLAD